MKLSEEATNEIIDMLRSSLHIFKQQGCSFWACPGYSKPFEDMKTCDICAQIQDIRALFKKNDIPE